MQEKVPLRPSTSRMYSQNSVFILFSGLSSIRSSSCGHQASRTNTGELEVASESLSEACQSSNDFADIRKRVHWYDVCSEGSSNILEEIKALREYISENDIDPSLSNCLTQAEMAMNGFIADLSRRRLICSEKGGNKRRIKIPSNWLPGHRIDVELDGVKYRGSIPPSSCRPGDVVEFDFTLGTIRLPPLTFQD
jgi:hypothetical protein